MVGKQMGGVFFSEHTYYRVDGITGGVSNANYPTIF